MSLTDVTRKKELSDRSENISTPGYYEGNDVVLEASTNNDGDSQLRSSSDENDNISSEDEGNEPVDNDNYNSNGMKISID